MDTLDDEVVLVLAGLERTRRCQHPVLMSTKFYKLFHAAFWMAVDHGYLKLESEASDREALLYSKF